MNTRNPIFAAVLIAPMLTVSVRAGVFEQNSVKGLWQLDDSLASRWSCQASLATQGFSISGLPGSQFLPSNPPRTWLDLASSTVPFGGLKQTERLLILNSVGPNGPLGATGTHSWTLVMDVRFPSITGWTALMQSTPTNDDDAEIFLNSNRQLYFIGANAPGPATDPLGLNTWYRLAFRAEYNAGTNTQILRAYINGTVTPQTAGNGTTAPLNGRYSLSSRVPLFSDDNDETARLDVGSVGFWGRALADADIATIGAWDADGIDWPNITPAESCPPLPVLTGIMKFGLFSANYSPDQNAIAATASAPTIPGTIAQVQIALGGGGGTIPGFPNHRFGGTVTGHVQPGGDVAVTQTVTVNYFGAGPDLGNVAGVSYARSALTLGSTGARGTVRAYLPAGFGVALTPLGKNTLVRANAGNVGLSQSLAPVLAATLTRSSFTTDLSSPVLYPIADRIPVRFATNSISWDPGTGQFTFSSTEDLVYHRQPQLAILLNQILNGRPGAANPASNEFYFIAAKQAVGSVTIGVRPGGAASMQAVTVTLDPLKFGGPSSTVWMHYPLLPITWNQTAGSQIRFANDAIDLATSKLAGATIAGSGYLQGVPTECAGTPGTVPPPVEGMHFLPASGEWRFTPDGGLRAEGTVQATATSTAPLTVEWGAYKEGAIQRYAHQIQPGFAACRVLTAGVFARADQLAGLAEHEKPSALFLTGFSAPSNATLSERPGTTAYYNGLADYSGFNLRCTPGSYSALSRLAGVPVPPYPLAPEAKYVLRPAGVTGRHLTAEGAPNIQFTALGADFNLTALNLAFLDGVNVASGVNGSLSVPAPADFNLAFKGLKFGGQGQLQEAAIATPQGDKTLGGPQGGYWGLKFTPLALEFPQPKDCPPPGPADAFIKVVALATLTGLTDQPLAGNISVLNGNLVVESDAKAKGNGPVSRFQPGALLTVNGPQGKPDWNVIPVTGISVNKHMSTQTGTLTVGGLMQLPFFEDMPVVLSTNSINTTPNPPAQFVRKPWASLTSAPYDPGHVGVPGGVPLDIYRTDPAHDPIATGKWQNLIAFDFPVHLGANQVFTSRTPVTDDLLLFKLTQAVKSMTPTDVELTFDGSGALGLGSMIPQINVGSLLQDSGLLAVPGLQPAIDGALDSVRGLDGLLADHLQELLKPGLAAMAASRGGGTFFSELASEADRAAKLDELVGGGVTPGLSNDVTAQFSSATSGINGRWRRDFLAEVTKARVGMQNAQGLVSSVANLQQLASAIGAKIGASDPLGAPETNALGGLQALFAQVIAQLQAVEVSLQGSGDLNTALDAALIAAGPTATVQKAVDSLKAKWAPANPNATNGLYATGNLANFQADLTGALVDRLAGSTFAGTATQLLRQYAGDPQTLARQAVDDTLRMAEQLVAASLNNAGAAFSPALGSLGGNVGAARLRGYARINGDALHELRLDGQARLKVPDDMKFDAWFLLRDLDSSTPASACLVDGGAEAEVGMGASAELDWVGKKTGISVGGKVALDGNGSPVGMSGDFAILGSFDFSEVKVNDLKLGFGFGGNNGYLYGRGTGKIASMSVSAGVFVGSTCDIKVIEYADDDIGDLLAKQLPGYSTSLPVTGAMVYAEGGMSLMPLIGVPPSCVLDLRVHGGQGYFYFKNNAGLETAGVKNLQGVSGELLCLVDVSGKFATVLAGSGTIFGGSPEITSINGTSAAKVKGTVGVGWFSYTFSKTIRLRVTATPLKWKLDY